MLLYLCQVSRDLAALFLACPNNFLCQAMGAIVAGCIAAHLK